MIMSGFYRNVALVSFIVGLVGCAALNTPGGGYSPRVSNSSKDNFFKPDVLSPAGSVASLLTYFDALRKLSPAELAKAIEQARKRYAGEKSDFYLLQYALALTVPGGDVHHARQLLEPLIKETKEARENSIYDRELRALAVLVYVDLNERQRLETGQQADRQRLEGNLQAQTQRVEELEGQLEALKSIEKNMLHRETPAKGKP